MPSVSLDKTYTPRYFNDSSVNNMLFTTELKMGIVIKNEKNKEIYDNFDSQFTSYLSKMSSNNVKKYVTEIFNKNLIYIGTTVSKSDFISSRILLDKSDKLNGVVLNSNLLEIGIDTGDTPVIDDCIYATYAGLIRAAVIINKSDVIKDVNLHKLISSYIYLIFLKGVGQKVMYNEKQKQFINMICIYVYFTHFYGYKSGPVISIMKNEFKDLLNKEWFIEFSSQINTKYTSIKDIPNIMIDLNVFSDSPSKIYLELLRLLGNSGFYAIISSLDQLIPLIIISKYSTNLYSKQSLTSVKLHESVEDIITKYIDTMEYQKSSLLGD